MTRRVAPLKARRGVARPGASSAPAAPRNRREGLKAAELRTAKPINFGLLRGENQSAAIALRRPAFIQMCGFNRVLHPGRGSLVLRPADRPIPCLYCYR